MKVRVLYFASVRDQTGRPQEEIELGEGATAGDLLTELSSRYPRLGGLVSSLMVSVNQDYAEKTAALRDGDEVALIPPVSGG